MSLGPLHAHYRRQALSPRRTRTATEPPRGQRGHRHRASELGYASGVPHSGGSAASTPGQPGLKGGKGGASRAGAPPAPSNTRSLRAVLDTRDS